CAGRLRPADGARAGRDAPVRPGQLVAAPLAGPPPAAPGHRAARAGTARPRAPVRPRLARLTEGVPHVEEPESAPPCRFFSGRGTALTCQRSRLLTAPPEWRAAWLPPCGRRDGSRWRLRGPYCLRSPEFTCTRHCAASCASGSGNWTGQA